MSEVKMIRLVSTNRGIPASLKSFKTINVQSDERQKVIRVALPKNVILGSSSQPTIVSDQSTFGEDSDGFPLSKNAQLARENRQKKKRYINGLESDLSEVKRQNEVLSKELSTKDSTIENLKKEIVYFKSILANVQEISSLVSTIKQDSNIPLSTSLRATKRSLVNPDSLVSKRMRMDRCSEGSGDLSVLQEECDWMQQSPYEFPQLDSESFDALSNFSEEDLSLFPDIQEAGVCLHVSNKKISLEFCPTCSNMAQENWNVAKTGAGGN